jgi:outer membrane protein assembly factor BamB
MKHTAILLLLLATCLALPARSAPTWTVFKHDNARTGRTRITGPQTNAVKWTTSVPDFGIQSPQVLAKNGTIYSGSLRGILYAFKPDGTIRWQRHLGRYQITAGPAIGPDGTIYVAAEDGILHALTSHGSSKWTFDLQGYAGPSASPALGADGTIYVGASKLFAIAPDGSLRWSYDTGGPIQGPPAIGRDGALYFPSTDYLYAVNPDGTLRWRTQGRSEYPLGSAPAIGPDETIYVNTNDGTLHAFRSDGTFAWKFQTPGIVMDVPSSPAVAADGTIYFGGAGAYQGSGGYFYALNPDGSLKWKYLAGCDQTAPSIGGDGTIYFASDYCGSIHALAPDGTAKWAYFNLFDYTRSAPVIGPDGTLYAGLLGGPLYPDQGGIVAFGP